MFELYSLELKAGSGVCQHILLCPSLNLCVHLFWHQGARAVISNQSFPTVNPRNLPRSNPSPELRVGSDMRMSAQANPALLESNVPMLRFWC